RPTLRTSGTLAWDDNQGMSMTQWYETVSKLERWAKKYELGLKPLSTHRTAFQYHYDTARLPRQFKVYANRRDISEACFGAFNCYSCNNPLDTNGKIYCSNCAYLPQCASCLTNGVRLHLLTSHGGGGRQAYYCVACSRKCDKKECSGRTLAPGGQCAVCDPQVVCIVCNTYKSKSKTELVVIQGADHYVCKTCKEKQPCYECKSFYPYDPLIKTTRPNLDRVVRVCQMCVDKKDEAKRVPLEAFDKEMLPVCGSLVIPTLPSRPFRTISIETEMNGDGPYLARTLYRCGLVPLSRVADYHSHADTNSDFLAFLKYDGSVSGGELISYLLNLDDATQADGLMDLLKKVNSLHRLGKVSFGSNCGGHIHVDAHNFGYANVWRLLLGFGYAEDPIFRIAGAGSPFGHRTLDPNHARHNPGVGYTNPPAKGPFGSKTTVGSSIKNMHRMSALNFQPFLHAIRNCQCGAWFAEDSRKCTCNLGKATIEWRVFNSTHNPRILHAWVALVQALHAWADEDHDPTPEWESEYPALGWTNTPFQATSPGHQDAVKGRLEWIHTQLPFTADERDSLCYAIEQSDMEILGRDYIQSLKELPNVADYEKPKPVRNPSRRQRAIKIAPPEPGTEGAYIGRRGSRVRQRANARYENVVFAVNVAAPPQNFDLPPDR
ncbi:MAG TPA: hypothetical protein VIY48_00645, partial [Candidatus Paceibacterota bacterium]